MKAVLILALVALCSAKLTTWTGASSLSNYWNDNGNWDNGAPSSGDDAVLNAARPCLITADVNVNSIKLSGSAKLTLTAFQLTASSISIQDSAVLQFQGGGAWKPSLKSTNLSTIASQGGLEFHSGNLEGNWEVASTGSITFPDPATAFLVNAQVKSQGTISFGGKSVFLNASTIYSEGSGKFVLNQGAVFATLDDTSALKSTAGVTINGQAEIQGNAFITGLVVSENSAVTFSKGSQSVVNGVTLKAGARLQNTASGQPTLNNVNGEAGSTLYAGLPLTVGGSVSLDNLNVDTHGLNTPASFTGTSALNVNNLIMTSGGVRLNGALNVNTLTVNSGVSFSGGSFNVKSSKFSVGSSGGVTQFNTIFNSLGDTTVLTSQLWNVVPPATLNFGGNASLSVQKDLQVFGVGPTQQMVLNLGGVANIASDASLSLTSLPVNGGTAGTWKVNGKLTVTSLSFITKTVSLPTLGSNFQIGGSTMTIGTVETASNYKLNVTDRGISYVTGPTIYGLSSTTATAIGITVSN